MSTVLRGNDNFDTAQTQACKAWVNFNGTGTVAIRAQMNVSSITDNGTADYTANFTVAMADANYATSIAYSNEVSSQHTIGFWTSQTTSGVRYQFYNAANSVNVVDKSQVHLAVFR